MAKIWNFLTFLVVIKTCGADWQFGAEHIYECHCAENAICDVTNGSCPDGCDAPVEVNYEWTGVWSGPACQIGNVAYGKNATQEHTHEYFVADRALDGNLDPDMSAGHCSFVVDQDNNHAWWQVDLVQIHYVLGVRVTNRNIYRGRLSQTDVETSMDGVVYETCGFIDNGDLPTVQLNCVEGQLAQYVRLRRSMSATDNPHMLQLCEVMVEGYLYQDCPNGFFGSGCVTSCNCMSQCDYVTGICGDLCEAGWQDDNCQTECASGSWGVRCRKYCNCRNATEECYHVTGACPISGCPDDFVGTGCDAELPSLSEAPTAIDVGATSVKLRFAAWSADLNTGHEPTDYRLQYRISGSRMWHDGDVLSLPTAVTYTVVLGGLQDDTKYYIRVQPLLYHDDDMFSGYPGDETFVRTGEAEPSIFTTVPFLAGAVGGFVLLCGIICTAVCWRRRRTKVEPDRRRRSTIVATPLPPIPDQVETEHPYYEINEVANRQYRKPKTQITAEEYLIIARSHIGQYVAVTDLAAHVATMKNKRDGIKQEYMDAIAAAKQNVKKTDNALSTCVTRASADNYSGVFYDLLEGDKKVLKETNSIEIQPNARLNQKYLLVQDQCSTKPDAFWKLIWTTGANRIVVLANGMTKPYMYWPVNDELNCGKYRVKILQSDYHLDFIIRNMTLIQGDESRNVVQFYMFNWPEHGLPIDTSSILEFLKSIRTYENGASGPMVVHCSKVLSRSGTFVCLDYGLRQANLDNRVDVFGHFILLNTFVTDLEVTMRQYHYIYDVLLEALQAQQTAIPCSELQEDLSVDALETLRHEYKVLMALTTMGFHKKRVGFSGGSGKNRFDLIPEIVVRPQKEEEGKNTYTSSELVKRKRQQYFVIPTPRLKSARHIWHLIFQQDCRTIVVLDEPTVPIEESPSYCPKKQGVPMTYGSLSVTLVSQTSGPVVTERQFSILHGRQLNAPMKIVKQFQLNTWWDCDEFPDSNYHLAELVSTIDSWQNEEDTNPIIVHAGDDVEKSCFFTMAAIVCEQIKNSRTADIFKASQEVRHVRPDISTTIGQFTHLYGMAWEYSQKQTKSGH